MEDDPVLSDILQEYLSEFYEISYAYDSNAVYIALETSTYDLFIFDVNVIGKTGIQLLKELRSFNYTTPTIMITAYNDTKHLEDAFDAGAHDYIKKPFELTELKLRIQNIKKIFNIEGEKAYKISENISYDGNKKILLINKKALSLSNKDASILSYLIKNTSRLVSQEELIQNIWHYDSIPTGATIRSHIRTLRELIGKQRIITLRGEGYMYE